MFTILMLGSGLLWTITYLLIILRSIRDKTYGMPLVALCANLSWEAIFSFVYPPHLVQHIVNLIWFSLDVVLFLQLLRAGPREFADISKRVFYSVVAVTLATCFCSVLLITVEFHDQGTYSAFGQNLLMSALFIAMLYRRRGLRGQSLLIAICKGGGTLLASVAFWLYVSLSQHSVLLPFLYVAIAVYDLLYMGLIYYYGRAQGSVSQEPPAIHPQEAIPL